MPRVTYADRLKAIITNPAVSSRDQGFAESLLSSYSRRGSLSAGRKRCLLQLEERYSAENLAKAAENPIHERLAAAASRVAVGTWDQGFVESVTEQVKSGRQLSERQLEILTKIEARYSPEAIEQASTWRNTYLNSQKLRHDAKIVAEYYNNVGYFSDLATSILDKEDFVPTEKQYKAITGNKYAQKILKAWYDEPKYEVGSYVYFRDTSPGSVRKGIKGPCVVVKTNANAPTTAARGTKVYQVLPFSLPTPVLVEERYLKKARVGGNK
jgi:hypothetical protein